jgi:hypothetical protein
MVLLEDSERVPDVFLKFGAIPQSELSDWLKRHSLVLPSDLVELWHLTGGGDVFESETILRPSVPTPPSESFIEDDIESANLAHDANGKPSDLYLFHQGTFLSAVRLPDQKFVTLTREYAVQDSFDSLDEWYVRTLRAEFGERYGLAPGKGQ